MIGTIVVFVLGMLFGGVLLLVMALIIPVPPERSKDSNTDGRMTPTGETFEAREWWHDHGELSPGEHTNARAIREMLRSKGLIED
jgi:hypothetical protein